MREPELVFKAQQAAAALERAWERWREVHGMTADPMPAISSYVGYSLEEPWGQPRVVFGISADDAEQLVALLDRHDCIGPVHNTIGAGQGGREIPSEVSDPANRMVPVPRQAPSLAAGSVAAVSQEAGLGRGLSLTNSAVHAVEQDGPVFRELMAAARQTSDTRMPVHAGAGAGPGDAGSAVGVLDAERHGGEAVAPDSGSDDARPRGADNGAVTGLDAQHATHAGGVTPWPSPAGAAADAEPAAQAEETEAASETGAAGSEPAAQADEAPADPTKDAGIDLAIAPADADNAPPGDSADDPPGELANGPGPLAQAASTARVEAEARIRAAMGQGQLPEPSASEDPAAAEPQAANPGDSATIETAASEAGFEDSATAEAASDKAATDETTDEAATDETTDETATEAEAATTPVSAPPRAATPAGKRGSAKKPPVDAGAGATPVEKPEPADEPAGAQADVADRHRPHDIASSPGRPESGVDEVSGPTIGAFGFGSDLVGSVGSYNEAGTRSDQSQEHPSPGYTRRSRNTRSYSIPKLSKSRRAGVSPGA